MSTNVPIDTSSGRVLPPSVTVATPISALASVGTKHRVFAVEPSAQVESVVEADGMGADADDLSVPMVLPGIPVPGAKRKPATGAVASPAAPAASSVDEGVDGILGEYAMVARSGAETPTAPAPAPKQKHSVNERVMTLGELLAEREKLKKAKPQVNESQLTGLASLQAMFPRR